MRSIPRLRDPLPATLRPVAQHWRAAVTLATLFLATLTIRPGAPRVGVTPQGTTPGWLGLALWMLVIAACAYGPAVNALRDNPDRFVVTGRARRPSLPSVVWAVGGAAGLWLIPTSIVSWESGRLVFAGKERLDAAFAESLTVGVLEELIFRVLVLGLLVGLVHRSWGKKGGPRRVGTVLAIGLSAFVFAAAHFVSGMYLPTTEHWLLLLSAGLLLAGVYLRSGFFAAWFAHTIGDTLIFAF